MIGVSEKRTQDPDEIDQKIKVLIVDIEGTTTSISFVKETLFPYIREHLLEYLKSHWKEAEFAEDLILLKKQAECDKENGVEGFVPIPSSGENEEMICEAVHKNILWQMDLDRKTTALKQLQGHVMKEGYLNGKLKGHVYDDVQPALKSWTHSGRQVYVYSSGSVAAQKLLFGFSEKGDLLEFFSGHFDTEVGPKAESSSYSNIAKQLNCKKEEILFLTDILTEATAAKEAGLQAVLVSRPGNAPFSNIESGKFRVIKSFDDIVFEASAKRTKLCKDETTQSTSESNVSANKNEEVSMEVEDDVCEKVSEGVTLMSDSNNSKSKIISEENGSRSSGSVCQISQSDKTQTTDSKDAVDVSSGSKKLKETDSGSDNNSQKSYEQDTEIKKNPGDAKQENFSNNKVFKQSSDEVDKELVSSQELVNSELPSHCINKESQSEQSGKLTDNLMETASTLEARDKISNTSAKADKFTDKEKDMKPNEEKTIESISESVAEEKTIVSTAEQKIVELTANGKMVESAAQEKIVECTTEKRVFKSTTEVKEVKSTAEENSVECVSENMAVESVAGEKVVKTATEEKADESATKESTLKEMVVESTTEEKTVETLAEDKTVESTTEEKTVETLAEDKTVESTTEENTVECTTEGKTAESSAEEKIVESTTEEKTAESTTEEKTAESTTEEKTAESTTEEKTADSTTEGKTVKSTTGGKTVESINEEKTAESSTVEMTVESSAEEKTTESSAEEKASKSSAEEKTAESSTEEKTAESSTEEKTAESSTEEKTAESSTEEKTAGSSTEGKTAGSSTEGKTAGSSTEGKTAGSSTEGKTAGSSTEEKTAESSTEGKTAESSTEEKIVDSSAEEKPVESLAEEKPVESLAEEKPAESSAEEKPVESLAEEKPAESSAEEKPVESSAEGKTAESSTEEKASKSSAEEKIVESLAEEKTVESLAEEKTDEFNSKGTTDSVTSSKIEEPKEEKSEKMAIDENLEEKNSKVSLGKPSKISKDIKDTKDIVEGKENNITNKEKCMESDDILMETMEDSVATNETVNVEGGKRGETTENSENGEEIRTKGSSKTDSFSSELVSVNGVEKSVTVEFGEDVKGVTKEKILTPQNEECHKVFDGSRDEAMDTDSHNAENSENNIPMDIDRVNKVEGSSCKNGNETIEKENFKIDSKTNGVGGCKKAAVTDVISAEEEMDSDDVKVKKQTDESESMEVVSPTHS